MQTTSLSKSPFRWSRFIPRQFSLSALLVLITVAAFFVWGFNPPSNGRIPFFVASRVKAGMSKLQVIDVVGKDAKVFLGALSLFPNAQEHWVYRVWNGISEESMTVVFDSAADKVMSVEFKPWRDN